MTKAIEIRLFKCKSCGGMRPADDKDLVNLIQENDRLKGELHQRQIADENNGDNIDKQKLSAAMAALETIMGKQSAKLLVDAFMAKENKE